MKVIVAKTAGFCFGVKRAVEQVYEQIEKAEKPVYTYGPIIHNEFVVKDLEEKGVRVLNTEEELAALNDGIVIIRSHGVGGRNLSVCEKDPPDRGAADGRRTPCHHHRKPGASGGAGHPRMGQ